MATETQSNWVRRVLGVTPVKADTDRKARGKLLPIWIEAKEEVDTGIGRLQGALRETGDEDLEQIAEFGLYGATTGEAVRLMAALREADSIEDSDEVLAKLADAIEDYREFLDGAPIVDLIEENPFGVRVPMRDVLGGALRELDRRIAA